MEDCEDLVSKQFGFIGHEVPFQRNCHVQTGDLLLVLRRPNQATKISEEASPNSSEEWLQELFPEAETTRTSHFKLIISKAEFTWANNGELVGIPIANVWNHLGRLLVSGSAEHLEIDSTESAKMYLTLMLVLLLALVNVEMLLRTTLAGPVRVVRHAPMDSEFQSRIRPKLPQLFN